MTEQTTTTRLTSTEMLMALALTRGTLVCSADVSEQELREADDDERFFEHPGCHGYGFVLRLPQQAQKKS